MAKAQIPCCYFNPVFKGGVMESVEYMALAMKTQHNIKSCYVLD